MVAPVVTSRDALLFNWNLTETLPIGRHFDLSLKQDKKDQKKRDKKKKTKKKKREKRKKKKKKKKRKKKKKDKKKEMKPAVGWHCSFLAGPVESVDRRECLSRMPEMLD